MSPVDIPLSEEVIGVTDKETKEKVNEIERQLW